MLWSQQRKAKLWDMGTLITDNDFTEDRGKECWRRWPGWFLALPRVSCVALDKMLSLFDESLFSRMQNGKNEIYLVE